MGTRGEGLLRLWSLLLLLLEMIGGGTGETVALRLGEEGVVVHGGGGEAVAVQLTI